MSDAPEPLQRLLISVLFSTFPLSPSLALTLYQLACDLHLRQAPEAEVAGDFVSGKVKNLHRHVVLGAIAGPAFEADLETDRGPGQVRFLLTREGIARMQAAERPELPN